MKISFKGDYALKTILELAINYNSGVLQIKDIAKKLDIPVKYLEQILLILKGYGYVESSRGPKGGYYLLKQPSKIKLGEIIRLMEGSTAPIACVSSSMKCRCADEPVCAFRPVWLKIKEDINKIVDNLTFEDMCKKVTEINRKKNVLNYYI